jgi:hypothetical protein
VNHRNEAETGLIAKMAVALIVIGFGCFLRKTANMRCSVKMPLCRLHSTTADETRLTLRNVINVHGCKILLAGCFAAGTKLLTREGWRAVETLREGDELASRAEQDPYGAVSYKPIEEVFIRTGRVLHLHLAGGQTIRTTPEHPFWVQGEGWLPADLLNAGDALATLGGEWITVAEAFDTGEYETVYNCRVAQWHTYFVGGEEYVTAVWAHNTYEFISGRKVADDVQTELNKVGGSLSATNRTMIIDFISKPDKKEAKYGRVGDQMNLVDWIVKQLRPANGTSPPHPSLTASLTAYFQSAGTREASRILNGYLEADKGPNGETFSERVVAPAEQNKPEIKKSGWIAYIHSFNNTGNYAEPVPPGAPPNLSQTYHNADVTGRSYRKADDDFENLTIPSGISRPDMHGHHIIFKAANGKLARESAQEAKDMVLRFDINPFWDAACLAYAPNWGHNGKVMKNIKDEIAQNYPQWLTLSLSAAQTEIKELMANIAMRWCRRDPTLGF